MSPRMRAGKLGSSVATCRRSDACLGCVPSFMRGPLGPVLLWGLLVAGPVPLRAQAVVMEGVVVDSTDTSTSTLDTPTSSSDAPVPLSGARVRVWGVEGEVEADGAGRFRLELPGPGTYELTFHHPRLDSIGIEDMGWTPVRVPEGGAGDVELAVPSWPTLYGLWCGRDPGAGAEHAIVAGWVRSTLDSLPLAGLPAELRAPEDRGPTGRALSEVTRSDEDGLFLFCLVSPGVDYRLVVDAFGLEGVDEVIRVDAGEVVELEFGFEIGGEGMLQGAVWDDGDGAPVAEAVVELEGPLTRSALTDADGRFRVEGLAAGRYDLRVAHVAFRDVHREVAIPGNDRMVDVEVRLLPDAIPLEPIVVRVEGGRRPGLGPLADVYDRMDRMRGLGLGRIFDRREIVRSGTTRISHLVAQVVGVRGRPVPGSPGLILHLNHRACPPSVYIDGLPARGMGVDDILPSTAEAVEVYRRLSELPGEFWDDNSSRCGAIAIWTRRGR